MGGLELEPLERILNGICVSQQGLITGEGLLRLGSTRECSRLGDMAGGAVRCRNQSGNEEKGKS